MSEKKNDNNVAKTPDGNTVEIVEKKGFFQKIKDKKDAFVEKHPVGCRRAKTITVGALSAIGGFAAGALLNSRSKDNSGIEVIDIDTEVGFDDAAVNAALEEVNDDNN